VSDATTSFVGVAMDWRGDRVMVWERPIAGGPRTMRAVRPEYAFYVPDENGEHLSIYRTPLRRLEFEGRSAFDAGLRQHPVRFESDIPLPLKTLMRDYYGRPTPVVHYALLDIEVDYQPELGFSSPENPYAPINAMTVYQSWTGRYLTFAVPPKSGVPADFDDQLAKLWAEHEIEGDREIVLCADERELLRRTIAAIEDADILSGWNSEFFDLPYIVSRLQTTLGDAGPAKLCLPGASPPRLVKQMRFGSEAVTYKLSGRTHLDYLELFKKFVPGSRASFSLGAILTEELDMEKLSYDGTLAELYNQNFARFCAYNRRDVGGLVGLEKKFGFMKSVNQVAHENTCGFDAILGTVRYVEMGVLNRMHRVHGLRMPDKAVSGDEAENVEGAVVLLPHAGLQEMLAAVDINSLYPSVMRALNMSLETFVGQFTGEESDWVGLMETERTHGRTEAQMAADLTRTYTLQLADGTTMDGTRDFWRQWMAEAGMAVSGFGTVFDQSFPGMLADTLTFWFAERKRLQAEKKKWGAEAKRLKKETGEAQPAHALAALAAAGIELDKESKKLAAEANKTKVDPTAARSVAAAIRSHELHLLGGKLYTAEEWAPIAHADAETERYDLLQGAKKLQLNSTYGATLNRFFGFGRREIGASVTATGRHVTAHMIETIHRLLTGERTEVMRRFIPKADNAKVGNPAVHLRMGNFGRLFDLSRQPLVRYGKSADKAISYIDSPVIIYGDTDSCYFKTQAPDVPSAIKRADQIAADTNASFPAFMRQAFNAQGERAELIRAVREIVGDRALFLTAKKKYTIHVVDKEGSPADELKFMGSELKKADTPKQVRLFLRELMDLVLAGEPYEVLEKFVNDARGSLVHSSHNPLELAPIKQVNNLDALYAEWTRTEKPGLGKVALPGHVRAAVNYNELVQQFERGPKLLRSGDKAILLYLRPNPVGIKSIAFPSDLERLPAWFTENFDVDLTVTESKMIDSKVEGIFDALGREVPTPQTAFINQIFTF
jgi:DNA polymerase elongation subunit (family B)